MEKKYEYGEQVYLAVTVNEVGPGGGYDYNVVWKDHVDRAACMTSVGEEQLFTAQEIADQCGKDPIDWQAKYNEYNEKAEAKIRELATRLNGMAESLREAQAKAVSLYSALTKQIAANTELEGKNDELETTVSELSVLVDKTRKEMAQREKGWDNVSRNNDIAKVNLNRLCKQREILTDRIIALEAELEEERKKSNG